MKIDLKTLSIFTSALALGVFTVSLGFMFGTIAAKSEVQKHVRQQQIELIDKKGTVYFLPFDSIIGNVAYRDSTHIILNGIRTR
jgi:hypothetical protein